MVLPPALIISLLLSTPSPADRFRVTNTNDSGTGSLRWAITEANNHLGQDTIKFRAGLAGRAIFPSTPLPAVTDHLTLIDADVDDDGKPDVALNGRNVSSGSGLVIQGGGCIVSGLAIVRFHEAGIYLDNADDCTIQSCHVGVNLAGTKALLNWEDQIRLWYADDNWIGGHQVAERNVIGGGHQIGGTSGVRVVNSWRNRVKCNYIGLNRDGMSVLGRGGSGIKLEVALASPFSAEAKDDPQIRIASPHCQENEIGGRTPAERNVIGGVVAGVFLDGAEDNVIEGNYLGLARDGDTSLPISGAGVMAISGSRRNRIGGPSPRACNVFAGGAAGVMISGQWADENTIQGNYFGLNATGTQQRRLRLGVAVMSDAGAHTIGGATPRAGNYFALKQPGNPTSGVLVAEGGANSVVRNNYFGVRPDGRTATPYDYAIVLESVRARIEDNLVVNAATGLRLKATPLNTPIARNVFRNCSLAVHLEENARCVLGNLDNTSPRDDGENTFHPNNDMYIHNDTPYLVKAENNDFGTTSRSEINAKITDRRDTPSLGRVDFSPLMGGVLPTGEAGSAVAITGATAAPTGNAGAHITFGLSAPACVTATVLNIAGRPVRTLCRAKACEAGPNTILWSGQTDTGLALPNGTYLVALQAGSADGGLVRALTRVFIHR
jgi:hypothetical protein